MENIYNTWTQFNKTQREVIKKTSPINWNEIVERQSQSWRNSLYPHGEYWKYISYNQLPSTSFVLPRTEQTNRQVASANEYSFEISDFSGSQLLQKNKLPSGLHIHSTLEEINGENQVNHDSIMVNNNEKNPFVQSALSFINSGLVIKIDQKTRVDRAIKIIFNLNQLKQKDALVVFNLIIDMEEKSSAELFIEIQGDSFTGLANFNINANIQKGASLTILNKETGGAQSHICSQLLADLDEKASLRSFDITLPGLWSRHNLIANLNGTQSLAELKGGYFNRNNYYSDHHTEINHWHKNTSSQEDYRGILTDEAKAVFNGKIFIEKKAAQSSSELLNKNLLLSKKAEVNTKPELQIYNDDVKAAHGATVGSMNEEQKFYLLSRGFSPAKANQILSQAFIFELFEQESQSIKDFYRKNIEEVLSDMGESQ